MEENQENKDEQVNESAQNENVQNEVTEQNSENVQNEVTEQNGENVQNEVTEQNSENVQNEVNEQNTSSVDDKTVNLNYTAEDLKNETKQTVDKIKETIKTADLKKDSNAAKGFFSSFFKNPLETIKKCASDSKSNFLRVAIVILLVWLVALFVSQAFSIANRYLFGTYGSFSYFFKNLFHNIFDVIKELIAPIISIAVLSGLAYVFNKKKDKSFVTVASTIVIAHIPVVIASIVNLLVLFGTEISKITSHFSSFCDVLYVVLLYFAIKHLSGESENKSYFWKFALIIGIFYAVKFVFSYLGIYL